MKPWVLYIIQNPEGLLYVGISNRPEIRLKHHNEGKGARFTKGKGPWVKVYQEEVGTMSQALSREYRVKRFSKVRKLALIATQAIQ